MNYIKYRNMNQGYVRVAAAVPGVSVADCRYNVQRIIELCEAAANRGSRITVFPELSITSYSCGDLFTQDLLLESVHKALGELRESSRKWDSVIFVGAPLVCGSMLFNCAVAIEKGKFIGVIPKTYIPNYKEFYEKRWFEPGDSVNEDTITVCGEKVAFGTDILFVKDNIKIAVDICEDLWAPVPPSSIAALNGANIIVNLSASNELAGKHAYLRNLIRQQSARCFAAYIYSSAGYGESTTDIVFSGNAIVSESGTILAEAERFASEPRLAASDIDINALDNERLSVSSFRDSVKRFGMPYREIILETDLYDNDSSIMRDINPHPFIPVEDSILNERCEEIINIQTQGLMKRLEITGSKNLVVGVSGGLDSTLALLVAVRAFDRLGYDRAGITGITMPGFGTTGRTYHNAMALMGELGVSIKEIPIRDAVIQHFKDIGHDMNCHDVTYENSQARERTQILMDYANKCNGIVLGTGDLSELALGWATYNGDHMSMYGVNAGVPKTLVKYLVKWFSVNSLSEKERNTLADIVDTPISPELVPAGKNGDITQKTEDIVGPYELHDFFLYHMLRHSFAPSKIFFLAKKAFAGSYDDNTVKHWMRIFYRRFFTQQFKRSCMPDGPKIGSVSLSPRGDWRMPSDAVANMWIRECDKL